MRWRGRNKRLAIRRTDGAQRVAATGWGIRMTVICRPAGAPVPLFQSFQSFLRERFRCRRLRCLLLANLLLNKMMFLEGDNRLR